MNINPAHVNDVQALIDFINTLSKDATNDADTWQNNTIPDYLEAIASFLAVSSRRYTVDLGKLNPYRAIASALYIGKIYE